MVIQYDPRKVLARSEWNNKRDHNFVNITGLHSRHFLLQTSSPLYVIIEIKDKMY